MALIPGNPDAPTSSFPGVLQFMQLLWAVVHGVESASKRMAYTIGVTGPQRLVIRVVGLCPGLSAGALSSALHLHPSTLTGILQRLVAQGLLERVEHRDDRRRAVLRLTARGRRVNAARAGTVEAAVARALRDLSHHDRAATARVLGRLAESLEPRPVSVAATRALARSHHAAQHAGQLARRRRTRQGGTGVVRTNRRQPSRRVRLAAD